MSDLTRRTATGFLVLKDGRRHHHDTQAAAEAEAARLASRAPGQTFIVTQAVSAIGAAATNKEPS